MIHPLVPYALRGAIWYQGEANNGQHEGYSRLFPAMIKGWRAQFGQGDFPFYWAQLASLRQQHRNQNGLLPRSTDKNAVASQHPDRP